MTCLPRGIAHVSYRVGAVFLPARSRSDHQLPVEYVSHAALAFAYKASCGLTRYRRELAHAAEPASVSSPVNKNCQKRLGCRPTKNAGTRRW